MKTRFNILIAFAFIASFSAFPLNEDEGSITDAITPMIDSYPNKYATGTLPIMYINTENGAPIESKEVYINATYFIENTEGTAFEAVGSFTEQLPMEIRGRGHSSWNGAKKPYKLKLGDKKALLGMPKSKHWVLIKPLESNVAGYQLGRILGMPWAPNCQPVEVVLNDDFIGLYFLTENVRIAKDRVNIYEQADLETDPDLIAGGWLVEIDNYSDENQIAIREGNGKNMNVKYHSPEVLSPEQKTWLTDEFNAANAAIYSADKYSAEWEKHIDVEAMARFFIAQEVMDNPDGFHGSFYLHKDLGEDAKWVAGPLWDLVCYHREKTDYTFKMKVHYAITPHWIGEIIKYNSFCKAVDRIWHEAYPDRLSEIYQYIDDAILPLAQAWSKDCQRWGDDPSFTASFRAERLKNSLERNIEWFNSHLPVSPYASIDNSEVDTAPFYDICNLQGMRLGRFDDYRSAISSLPAGIYIVNGKKLLKR